MNRAPRLTLTLAALVAVAACTSDSATNVVDDLDAPSISAAGQMAPTPLRIDQPVAPRVEDGLLFSAGGTILTEAFDDPLSGWKTRFMGLYSNLQNLYVQYGSCWSGPNDEDCRGNNLDGIWIADDDNSNSNSYIRFDAGFAETIQSFAMDIGSHIGGTLTVYDADLNVILSSAIPYGCSNCAYGSGSNIYHNFAVTSTNGVGGFDITGSWVEGNVGIDNIVLEVGPADPQTKDECKKGGWEDFGFKNQGQCVRFIETGKDSR